MRPLDLTGQRFGRLVALHRLESARSPGGTVSAVWLCRCDCGKTASVQRRNLRSGSSTSCGCFHREVMLRVHTRHGEAPRGRFSPEYACWANIVKRCENPNTGRTWRDYGGRGIRVCERWRGSFEAFLADMGRKPSPRHPIDRIDVNGHYEPGNCRWATPKEQRLNQRRQQQREAHG